MAVVIKISTQLAEYLAKATIFDAGIVLKVPVVDVCTYKSGDELNVQIQHSSSPNMFGYGIRFTNVFGSFFERCSPLMILSLFF